MINPIMTLGTVNYFMNPLAFKEIEFFNIALIIFSIIFVCLSYVLYKLYRANKENKSISRIRNKSALKEIIDEELREEKQLNNDK